MSTLYEIQTEHELMEYLQILYSNNRVQLEDRGKQFGICMSGFYSGCNYYINKGNNEWEPLGSATSMHDCDGCDKLSVCQLKKNNEIWFYKGADKNESI